METTDGLRHTFGGEEPTQVANKIFGFINHAKIGLGYLRKKGTNWPIDQITKKKDRSISACFPLAGVEQFDLNNKMYGFVSVSHYQNGFSDTNFKNNKYTFKKNISKIQIPNTNVKICISALQWQNSKW